MHQKLTELVERITRNPRTTRLGGAVGGIMLIGGALRENGIEPLASLVIGLGGVLAVVGLFLARDGG